MHQGEAHRARFGDDHEHQGRAERLASDVDDHEQPHGDGGVDAVAGGVGSSRRGALCDHLLHFQPSSVQAHAHRLGRRQPAARAGRFVLSFLAVHLRIEG